MNLWANLAAQPALYRHYIEQWDADHPTERFQPVDWQHIAAVDLTSMVCPPGHQQNMSVREVLDHLRLNRIPIEWVDHSYLYALHWSYTQEGNTPEAREIAAQANEERVRRVLKYGEPAAIEAWDGWHGMRHVMTERVRALMQVEVERGHFSLDANGWVRVGEQVNVTIGQDELAQETRQNETPGAGSSQDVAMAEATSSSSEMAPAPAASTSASQAASNDGGGSGGAFNDAPPPDAGVDGHEDVTMASIVPLPPSPKAPASPSASVTKTTA